MIVIDASVAIQCVIPEESSGAARDIVSSQACIAPDLIVSECMNALWKGVRRDRLTRQEALTAAAVFGEIGIQLAGASSLAGRALKLAMILDHPVYDCFYLALAEDQGLPLVTADKGLVRKYADAGQTGAVVHLLGEDWND